MIRRRCLIQGLMGTLLIVETLEDDKAPPLSPQGGGRWQRRLLLQGQMQPLQAPVLLRLTRIDALRQHTRLGIVMYGRPRCCKGETDLKRR